MSGSVLGWLLDSAMLRFWLVEIVRPWQPLLSRRSPILRLLLKQENSVKNRDQRVAIMRM